MSGVFLFALTYAPPIQPTLRIFTDRIPGRPKPPSR
jgi:hypothetical protein